MSGAGAQRAGRVGNGARSDVGRRSAKGTHLTRPWYAGRDVDAHRRPVVAPSARMTTRLCSNRPGGLTSPCYRLNHNSRPGTLLATCPTRWSRELQPRRRNSRAHRSGTTQKSRPLLHYRDISRWEALGSPARGWDSVLPLGGASGVVHQKAAPDHYELPFPCTDLYSGML